MPRGRYSVKWDRGQGLGKNEDGITEAIQVDASIGDNAKQQQVKEEPRTRKLVFILSDFMLR